MIESAVWCMQEKNVLFGRAESPLHFSWDKCVTGDSVAGSEVLFIWEMTDNLFCCGRAKFLSAYLILKISNQDAEVNSSCCNFTLLKCGKNVIWASYLCLIHNFKSHVIMRHLGSSDRD